MDASFWNERYVSKEYVYGKKPNTFFKDFINQESLEIVSKAWIEPSLEKANPGEHFQFIRKGYFTADERGY